LDIKFILNKSLKNFDLEKFCLRKPSLWQKLLKKNWLWNEFFKKTYLKKKSLWYRKKLLMKTSTLKKLVEENLQFRKCFPNKTKIVKMLPPPEKKIAKNAEWSCCTKVVISFRPKVFIFLRAKSLCPLNFFFRTTNIYSIFNFSVENIFLAKS